MTKILSIVPYKIFPAIAGGQKAIALFNKYLAKEVELICITVQANDPSHAKGYHLLNILADSPIRYINIFYIFRIAGYIRKYKPEYILLEHPYYGWLGVILKKITGTRLIIRSHNIEALRWKVLGKWWWSILWHYEKFTHRHADFNFFIQDNDRLFAEKHYGLSAEKCITVTYGTEWEKPPSQEELTRSKQIIKARHDIAESEAVLLFNGAFNYQPNVDALNKIIYNIHPVLQERQTPGYKILICGKDIPAAVSKLQDSKIIIAGFVDDVSEYFKGADVFLNPITTGGGIKTKLVEALGNNLNTVSTISGAIGVDPALCNGKLLITPDDNWDAFADAIDRAVKIKADIPARYFEYFYWGHAIKKAVRMITVDS